MYIKDNELHLVWCIDDVKLYAQTNMEESVELTDKECVECLGIMLRRHDCEYGTTWQSVECAINDMLRAKAEGV